ncbi:hypothetical protein INR49_031451 [Caranx melampygus]|nr:hypothetical protein INR49_031451 [Caranx melampygus]
MLTSRIRLSQGPGRTKVSSVPLLGDSSFRRDNQLSSTAWDPPSSLPRLKPRRALEDSALVAQARGICTVRDSGSYEDIDNSGYVSDFELQELFREASFSLPGYKIYQELKSKEISETFKKTVTRRDGIRSFGGMSRISSEGTQHSYSDEEKVAFVNWINKALVKDEDCQHLLPMNPHDESLFTSQNDQPVSARHNRRKSHQHQKAHHLQNDRESGLALNSASAIGCTVVNIDAHDLMAGKPHLVLGLFWQIIKAGLFADIEISKNEALIGFLEMERLETCYRFPRQ